MTTLTEAPVQSFAAAPVQSFVLLRLGERRFALPASNHENRIESSWTGLDRGVQRIVLPVAVDYKPIQVASGLEV